MLFRDVCAKRRGCMPLGLLLMAIGLVHQTLSPLWIGYFHLTGHLRSLCVDFTSGLALGLGVVLLVNSFRNDVLESAERTVDDRGRNHR